MSATQEAETILTNISTALNVSKDVSKTELQGFPAASCGGNIAHAPQEQQQQQEQHAARSGKKCIPLLYKRKGQLQKTVAKRSMPLLDRATMVLTIETTNAEQPPSLPRKKHNRNPATARKKKREQTVSPTRSEKKRTIQVNNIQSPTLPHSATPLASNKKLRLYEPSSSDNSNGEQEQPPGVADPLSVENTTDTKATALQQHGGHGDGSQANNKADAVTEGSVGPKEKTMDGLSSGSLGDDQTLVAPVHQLFTFNQNSLSSDLNKTAENSATPVSGDASALVPPDVPFEAMTNNPPSTNASKMDPDADGRQVVWLPEWSKPRETDQEGPIILRPHPFDVLLGRGNGTAQHPGNLIFRNVCWKFREDYVNATRAQKSIVAFKVLQQVHSQDPPGRFLEWTGHHFKEVPQTKATEKICQALREKKWFAPTPLVLSASSDGVQVKHKRGYNKKQGTSKKRKALSNESNLSNQPFSEKGQVGDGIAMYEGKPATSIGEFTVTAAGGYGGENAMTNIEEVKVGHGISVYWPLDDTFYKAKVLDRIANLFYLEYDDGVLEWLDLTANRFIITP